MTISEPPSYDLYQIAEAGFSTNNYIYLGIIVLLLLVSAMMSGSESAFFSLRPQDREEIKQENSAKSKLISDLLAKPKELLATILITNNFVNVGVVILSTFILNDFYPPTKDFEIKRFLLEVLGITFVLLMTGEVIPKIFAAKNSLRVVRWMVYPLNVLRKTPPLSWLKNLLVKGSFFIQKNAKGKTSITTDELEQAIALTKEDNDSEEDHKILEGIVKFGRTEACQIMTPRIEVDAIDISSNFKEVLAFILEAGYSRIPVFRDTQDNVVGILYIKDLLPNLSNPDYTGWSTVIRKPFFIPENKKINDLLQEFRSMKMHMAIVVDEYGGACGIITLEDILEEIVGDITDEFDDDEIDYSRLDPSTFIFEGRTSLNDLYKVLDIDGLVFENLKGEAETIGGFVVEQAGKILKNKEFIEVDNFKIIVESSDKRRVKSLKIQVKSQ